VLSLVTSLTDPAGGGGKFRPTVAEAMDLVRGRCAWSTTITTRFNAQLACLLGAAIYISDPLPG